MINDIYLSLGSNIGQRFQNLQGAVKALGSIMAVEQISPIYETAPWGITEQPEFLNICVRGKTRHEPDQLLSTLKAIETKLGRVPGDRWGPRLIDIDIVYYGQKRFEDEVLTIPHPEVDERAFVLAPLADIAAEFRDPLSGFSIQDMLRQIDSSGVKRLDGSTQKLKRPTDLTWGLKTYVMGILNITPDSFSGDGLYGSSDSLETAVEKAREFSEFGADIIDIGGESTRPGSEPTTTEIELERVLPVIEAVRSEVDLPISIDTYRSKVAEAALEAGADWINDVWGLKMDDRMPAAAARHDCPIILMHNRSKPKNVDQQERLGGRYVGIEYENLLDDIATELQASVSLAAKAGINLDKVIIDPGFGFGKTVQQNLHLLNDLNRLKALGYPILVGTSRKSFIGYSLGDPPENRIHGTSSTVAIAIDRGADIVRVHDVKAMTKVAAMTDKVVRN